VRRWRWRSGARGAVAAVAVAPTAALVAGCGAERGAFAPGGPVASDLDGLFWLLTGLGAAVLVLVIAVLALAAVRSRGRTDDDDEGVEGDVSERRSRWLVLGGGVVLPVVVLVPLTVVMLMVGVRTSNVGQEGDVVIEVVGHQFWWEVRYPGTDVVTANEIHVPVGRPVHLRMQTADVIHSLWVPELAGKIDMIPGEETELRFEASEPGELLGHCAEFCGLQHARMRFLVVAQPPEEFERWLTEQAAPSPPPATEAARRGEAAFEAAGCASCHAVRGTAADGDLGPDLTHLASRRTLGAGTLPNTPEDLARWVADPQEAKPGNLMPAIPLSTDQLQDLLAYLEELR
jgi:cytochrome c oxidase subunit 2